MRVRAGRDAVRHALLGAEVVLSDGAAAARFAADSMTDVAGFDTDRLFIGSGGEFGTISTAIFKVGVNPWGWPRAACSPIEAALEGLQEVERRGHVVLLP